MFCSGKKTVLDLGLQFTYKNGDFCAISAIKCSDALMHQSFKWRVIHVYILEKVTKRPPKTCPLTVTHRQLLTDFTHKLDRYSYYNHIHVYWIAFCVGMKSYSV